MPPHCTGHASGDLETAVTAEWRAGATIVTLVESLDRVAMTTIYLRLSHGTEILNETEKVLHDSQTSLG